MTVWIVGKSYDDSEPDIAYESEKMARAMMLTDEHWIQKITVVMDPERIQREKEQDY